MEAFPLSIASSYPTMRIARHPIHSLLAPIPIVCFVGGLSTDLIYWRTANMMWADFSAWLVTVGVVMAYLAALVGVIDFLSNRLMRAQGPAWPHVIGSVIVLVLATLDMFVHSRDAWTSVVPWGLILSAAVVLISLVTGWMGGSMVDRHDTGVAE
jgi:uncharacterized membrane protein